MFGSISLNFISILFICLLTIPSTLTLICYDCKDCTDVTCPCSNTTDTDIKTSYCILMRENLDVGINVEIKSFPRDATKYNVYDPYYISVEEQISYDKTVERWLSKSKKITYACQTDRCNQPDLLKQLPANGLSLMLPSDWLNENLLRKADQNMTLCHQCPDKRICGDRQYYMDTSQCNVKSCSDSCVLDETIETTQFCYQSFCLSQELKPEIGIAAIYYLKNKQFEIMETDIICNADDCTRLEMFKDIREKLQKDYTGIQAFLPANHAQSIYSTSIILMIMILFQQLVFY